MVKLGDIIQINKTESNCQYLIVTEIREYDVCGTILNKYGDVSPYRYTLSTENDIFEMISRDELYDKIRESRENQTKQKLSSIIAIFDRVR